ncbi:hypothetical protein COAQ111491_21895 [Comamonas aquatilis]|uniref:hypothetical protein n=1 Tax=Comamonas aquatilis TaxID=1778406 RepID=UPI0039F034F4
MSASRPTFGLPFLGINNRFPDARLERSRNLGGGMWVRDAVNVDLTAKGTFRGRQGYGLAMGLAHARSLAPVVWGGEAMAVCASGTNLLLIRELDAQLQHQVLRNDVRADRSLSVAASDGWAVVTDGHTNWWLDASGARLLGSQPGDIWSEYVSNTQTIRKFHGFDGVVRSYTETWA